MAQNRFIRVRSGPVPYTFRSSELASFAKASYCRFSQNQCSYLVLFFSALPMVGDGYTKPLRPA